MSALHVICKLGESEYAVPANEIFQMEAFNGATPVPGAPAYVVGLVQVRSQIVPILDLRVRFGMEAMVPTLASRIVVIKIEQKLFGILVDSAREVQNIAEDQFTLPPNIVTVQSAGFVKSVAQLKNRIIMLLDSKKIIGEEISRV